MTKILKTLTILGLVDLIELLCLLIEYELEFHIVF